MPNKNIIFKISKITNNLDLENEIVSDAMVLWHKVFIEEKK